MKTWGVSRHTKPPVFVCSLSCLLQSVKNSRAARPTSSRVLDRSYKGQRAPEIYCRFRHALLAEIHDHRGFPRRSSLSPCPSHSRRNDSSNCNSNSSLSNSNSNDQNNNQVGGWIGFVFRLGAS